MKLSVASKNLPPAEQVPRRKSPRNRVETEAVLETREREEREEEVRIFENVQKLEEKMDDLLSKTKLPDDAENIDPEILEKKATSYLNQTSPNKVNKMYDRYQNLWKNHCMENMISEKEECDDKNLKNFFQGLDEKYAPSTLWVVYSCVNSYFIEKFGRNLKEFPRLTKFLKNKTHRYVTTKSKVLTPEEVQEGLMTCMNSKDEMKTHLGVSVAFLYFGLLRSCDLLKVQMNDVSVDKNGRTTVSFMHQRKRINHGFEFYIPAIYRPLMDTYLAQLKPETKGKSRFLKNWNSKAGYRVQNTGRDKVMNSVNDFCDVLGICSDGYTSHCFRRSAATNLADAGVSLVNLKRMGQWKADSSAERYLENSKPIKEQREKLLMPVKEPVQILEKPTEDLDCYIEPNWFRATRRYVLNGDKMTPSQLDAFLDRNDKKNEVEVTKVTGANKPIDEKEEKKGCVKSENVVSEVKVNKKRKEIRNPYLKSPARSPIRNPYLKSKVIDLAVSPSSKLDGSRTAQLKSPTENKVVPVNTPFPNKKKYEKKDESNAIFSNGGNVFNNCVFNF